MLKLPGFTINLIQAPARSSNPKRAPSRPAKRERIFVNWKDGIVAETVVILRVVEKSRKLFLVAIKFIESAIRCNPERVPRSGIFMDWPNRIVTKAVGILGIVHKMGKLLLAAIKLIESAKPCSNPERAGTVFIDWPNTIMTKTVGIIRLVDKMGEVLLVASKSFTSNVGGLDKSIESAAIRSNPEYTKTIFADWLDKIIIKTVWVLQVIGKAGKLLGVAIKLIESPATSSNPKRVPRIFTNWSDTNMTKTVGIFGVVDKVGKSLGVAIKLIESPATRSNPKCVPRIFTNWSDTIIVLLWKNYHDREDVYAPCKTNPGNSLFRQ